MIVVPTYNMILCPDAVLYLPLELLRRSSGGRPVNPGDRLVLIAAKENQPLAELTEDSFYPLGVAAAVGEMNRQGFAQVRTACRVELQSVGIDPDRTIRLAIARRPDGEDLDPALEAEKVKSLLREMRAFAAGFPWASAVEPLLEQIRDLGSAACLLSPWLELSTEDRYAILAEDSRAKRAELIEKALYGFLEVGRITNEAVSSQQQESQQRYKEAAIRRQLEHLQRELDEMHPENLTDVQKFERKIAESGMNETARREAEKVLNRLRQEGRESVETGMLYDWLDFMTGLSWKKEEARHIDLADARRILDEDHYGLKKVKERILQQIAVMNLKRKQSGSILLFVGAPGTGKTSIGRSIARALGREYVRVSLGGVHDESDIRGHRRTYIGAMPGRIMDGIQKSGASNPVVVLDEVDKLSASYNGSPASALLEVLDPEQNSSFTDHYMNVPYDLSDVLFICTANTADTIPEPLLNRMEVIQFTGYTPLEKLQIARNHLLPRSMEAMGIPPERLSVPEETLEALIADYTMEAGVRGLRKHADTLCRSLAVKVAEDPETRFTVSPEDLRELLEERPIPHSRILREPRPGVVTGLAWTQAGGEILFIETLFVRGRGDLIITGQLGDVMKESVRIAVSLVKAAFPAYADLFRENDLHVHVPAGAVPKDGPSAGVTLTTALASLVTGQSVDPRTAMTGEVSLRGAVTPIGGLPETLMAAQRAGVTRVYIPADNLPDLKDVSPEVRDKLEIIPVSRVEELLTETGVLPPAALSA